MVLIETSSPLRIRAFAAHHPIAAFLIMVFSIAYPVITSSSQDSCPPYPSVSFTGRWPFSVISQSHPRSPASACSLLGALVRPLLGLILRGSKDSLLAVAMTHSVFNRTNHPDGISASMLSGDGYRLEILIALLVLTTALALVLRGKLGPAFRRQLDGASGPAQQSAPHS